MKSPTSKNKTKREYNLTEKFFVILLSLTLTILLIKIFWTPHFTTHSLFTLLSLSILFSLLLFLAYYDFKYMQVHNPISFSLMIFLILLNILLYILNKEIQISNNWTYIPYNNILGILILGSIFQSVVLISKEKALGQGDVRIALIVGSLVGSTYLIYWSYITVFSALIYGLYISYKKKKFKDLKIPFVPFMVLGTILLILYLL